MNGSYLVKISRRRGEGEILMATSSIKVPIRVTSVEGARVLCEAYEKGLSMDASYNPAKRLANGRLSVGKQRAIDKLFAKMGI